MICKQCSVDNPEENAFCVGCGAKMAVESDAEGYASNYVLPHDVVSLLQLQVRFLQSIKSCVVFFTAMFIIGLLATLIIFLTN